jgi:hypothetical protein
MSGYGFAVKPVTSKNTVTDNDSKRFAITSLERLRVVMRFSGNSPSKCLMGVYWKNP